MYWISEMRQIQLLRYGMFELIGIRRDFDRSYGVFNFFFQQTLFHFPILERILLRFGVKVMEKHELIGKVDWLYQRHLSRSA